MPTRELEPYVTAVPRITALRAVAAAEQIAVGMGRMPEHAHRETVDRWRRTIGATRTTRRLAPDQLAGLAAASGIGFRAVTPKPKPKAKEVLS